MFKQLFQLVLLLAHLPAAFKTITRLMYFGSVLSSCVVMFFAVFACVLIINR
ncbi:hypothetical protein IQ266_18850 [filamentous cyanobacterium LEGE 11480]|uniref:Uncharacterized protein n=1 Tax=Romeriopsis navalis LEGE 11480 TaxID=2777977 RepID=A0A928VQB9_9CYAN|nr:hypothetical protein [Romeriopsis navalis]MBE9031797.1 hypothetical protein [Romeriopsis navalis LEGE 11480]